MSPTAPSVPAGTTLGHSYEYGLDVNIGTTQAPIWQPARRISNFQPNPTPKTQQAQSYDDFGADNNEVVGWTPNLSFSIQGNRSTATGLYLPEVEALLARTRPDAKGAAAVVEVRWYHKPEVGTPNPNDAGQAFFTVSYQRANTGADGAIELLNFTLAGKGPAVQIVNPFTGWDAGVASLSAAAPSDAGEDDLVTITGSGFSGATDVLFGSTSATSFTVVGDATIVAVVPAGSAGSAAITVVNDAGTSQPLPYTRSA